ISEDSLHVIVYPLPVLSFSPSEPGICAGSSVVLSVSGADYYIWDPFQFLSSPTGSSVVANPPEVFTYRVTGTDQHDCKNFAWLTVHVYSIISSLLPDSVIFCPGDLLTLEPKFVNSGEYIWQDGTHGQYYSVTNPGIYWVTVKVDDCIFSDTVEVIPCTDIWVPNAFTPGFDDINNIFLAKASTELTHFQLQIFDRWGELIFESNDIYKGWDGTFKGGDCKQDVYTWTISYTGVSKKRQGKLTGTVTLLR
ncbi:MAG: gliding motility-associated C-terminal domain-containing protein, partial [Bacteroidetes bacterium]|nr:gliding motility-associated C-terminal domain-containing protein [Bacteroidota bacterium]